MFAEIIKKQFIGSVHYILNSLFKQYASIHSTDSFLHFCTGGRSQCHWLYALYITDLQICFWLSPWWCLLVHCRHWLDNRPLLHHVWPVSQRRHQCAGKRLLSFTNICNYFDLIFSTDLNESDLACVVVWRCAGVPSCGQTVGDHWEVRSL